MYIYIYKHYINNLTLYIYIYIYCLELAKNMYIFIYTCICLFARNLQKLDVMNHDRDLLHVHEDPSCAGPACTPIPAHINTVTFHDTGMQARGKPKDYFAKALPKLGEAAGKFERDSWSCKIISRDKWFSDASCLHNCNEEVYGNRTCTDESCLYKRHGCPIWVTPKIKLESSDSLAVFVQQRTAFPSGKNDEQTYPESGHSRTKNDRRAQMLQQTNPSLKMAEIC